MTSQDQLASWWKSLSDDERAAALEAQRNGELTDSVATSLQRAGALRPEQARAHEFPSEVERFLKARH